MAVTTNSDYGRAPKIVAFSELLSNLLDRAAQLKPTSTIEPALQKSDFGDLKASIATIFPPEEPVEGDAPVSTSRKARQFAAIEIAIRDLFSRLIAKTPIESPDFVRVWNLFDILYFLSEDSECDGALLVWLVEELLESQTIAGCRVVFDYLESRRERITTEKEFDKKKLVILRTCNELLRRLSRAEDTAFCGRVFIFMFQSFPLGDRSSINLRGEYHVENVTTYDATPLETEEAEEKMDVDKDPKSQTKAVSFNGAKDSQESSIQPATLYPVFWGLQENFSQPKGLFDPKNLAPFKTGLEATLKMFRAIQEEQGSRPFKPTDNNDGSAKRKRDITDDSGAANAFNPKYLTSRDLFELEISDLTFRRNILVQAFIIIEFLLSLSKQAKEKLASVKNPNKSVMYLDQELSEEDVTWAQNMKKTVEDCLKQGTDGPQFHRMVDTVLARDKNWVRWKVENCQPIQRPAVTPEYFAKAQDELRRMTANKRRRGLPLNSLPLDFMKPRDYEEEMNKFKAPERYQLPDLHSFKDSIARDDLEIEMPTNDESKAAAIESKASKQWRALRIAAKTRMSMFDKLSDPDNIDAIFGEPEDPDAEPAEAAGAENKEDAPTDARPIIISGPSGAGKTALVDLLTQRHAGTFVLVKRHTTRKPDEDPDKADHQLVEKQPFDMMRDGDVLLEYTTVDGADYGTSRRFIEAVATSGKVPLAYMDQEAVQQTRDNALDARFVLVLPPSRDVLEQRLRKAGRSDEAVAAALEAATPYLAEDNTATARQGFDLVLVSDDLETAFKTFKSFIYGQAEKEAEEKGDEVMKETNGEQADEVAPEQTQTTAEATQATTEATQATAETTEATQTQVEDTPMQDVAAPTEATEEKVAEGEPQTAT